MIAADADAFVRAVVEYEREHPELAELREAHSKAEVAFRKFCASLLPPMPVVTPKAKLTYAPGVWGRKARKWRL